ncbi:MAG: MATE family efflux transporter [Sandaracinaceae bacterium]|nr:MATE family efflux transporter [Sandaracinaceae bacterium]
MALASLWPAADRRGRILRLALPIIGGMISQNLLNLVNTGFVSSLGDEALAATGLGSFANFMSIAFVTGLSAGVQAMAARRKGEGAQSETAVPLNGGLLMALGFGIPIAIGVHYVAPSAFPALTGDPAVQALGITYLQIRLLSLPAVGMNFAFRGYWNAIDLPQLYLRTLVVMHLVNAALDYTLIFGHFGAPRLGVEGAAWASTIATWVGTLYYFAQAISRARKAGFMRGVPSAAAMWTMLRTSFPAALQQFFFAAGMTAFFAIVSRLGTAEVAASNVLLNLMLVAILPALGFGLASASLVGQSLGGGDSADARRWGWDVVRTAVPVVALIALPGLVFPDLVLGIFLHDPETLALARAPMRVLALSLPLDVVGMVLMNALLGAGDSRRVLVISAVMQWVMFLPAAWLLGPTLGLGLTAVWIASAAYRFVQSIVFAALWRSEAWTKVKL